MLYLYYVLLFHWNIYLYLSYKYWTCLLFGVSVSPHLQTAFFPQGRKVWRSKVLQGLSICIRWTPWLWRLKMGMNFSQCLVHMEVKRCIISRWKWCWVVCCLFLNGSLQRPTIVQNDVRGQPEEVVSRVVARSSKETGPLFDVDTAENDVLGQPSNWAGKKQLFATLTPSYWDFFQRWVPSK